MPITENLSYGTAEINANPDELVSAARKALNDLNRLDQGLGSIKTHVQKTKGYWEGDAGNHHRRLFSDQQRSIAEIIKTLKERVSELEQTAAKHTVNRSDDAPKPQQLAANVIEF